MAYKVAARRVFGDGGYQVRSPSAAAPAPPAGITEVQAFTTAGSSAVSPETVAITTNTTVGNHLIIMVALSGGRLVTGVTDSKGNTYTLHYTSGNGSFVGVSILSCKITTQLVNGDTISVTPNVACFMAIRAQEYSGLHGTTHFRTDAANGQGWTNATTAATGGTTAGNSTAGDLVLGIFAGQNANNIATPGAGYTNKTGLATTGTVVTLDWESKLATGGSTETATATWSGNEHGAAGTIVFIPA